MSYWDGYEDGVRAVEEEVKDGTFEGQIFDAEGNGTAPSAADLRPQQFDEDAPDLPCQLCHYDIPRHAEGCPNGEDPNR